MHERNPHNRIKSWRGTVHYATQTGHTLCGTPNTAYSEWTIQDVTCQRCIAAGGMDELTGAIDPPVSQYADEHAARRAAERATRRAARSALEQTEPDHIEPGSLSGSQWYHEGMPS